MKYSFWIGLRKSLLQAVLFGLPFLITLLPEQWMNLTVGGLLSLAVNYVKTKYKISI